MKSATTHPTPQAVIDAIQVVAAWLRDIDAAEAVIAPSGGAAFHPTRQADELLAGWGRAEDRLKLAERIVHIARFWACHDAGLAGAIREWDDAA